MGANSQDTNTCEVNATSGNSIQSVQPPQGAGATDVRGGPAHWSVSEVTRQADALAPAASVGATQLPGVLSKPTLPQSDPKEGVATGPAAQDAATAVTVTAQQVVQLQKQLKEKDTLLEKLQKIADSAQKEATAAANREAHLAARLQEATTALRQHQAQSTQQVSELQLRLSSIQLSTGERLIAAARQLRKDRLAAASREGVLLQHLGRTQKNVTEQLHKLSRELQQLRGQLGAPGQQREQLDANMAAFEQKLMTATGQSLAQQQALAAQMTEVENRVSQDRSQSDAAMVEPEPANADAPA